MANMYNAAEDKGQEVEELDQLGPQEEVGKKEPPVEDKGDEEESEFDYGAFAEELENDDFTTEDDGGGGEGDKVVEEEPQPTPQEEEGKKEEPEPETPGETEEGKKEEPIKEEEEKVEKEEEVYTPPAKTESPEEYNARLEAARSAARKDLEERYKLSEDEADEILSDPGKALPKQLARVYTDVYEQVLGDVKAMFPGMVQQVVQQTEVQNKGREEFFTMFPDLKGLDQEAEQIAGMYLQQVQRAGKSISKEELFKKVGVQLSLLHNKPLPKNLLGGQEIGGNQEEAPVEKEKPFVPANAGQPSTPTGAGSFNTPGNMWEELAVDEDDYGD